MSNTQLRRAMDKILKEWGHNVLLQRHDDGKWTNTLEKHTVRRMLVPNEARLLGEMPEGLVSNVDRIYFFRYDSYPKAKDRIYESEHSGTEVYDIDFVEPMRGAGGNVEYFKVGATRDIPN